MDIPLVDIPDMTPLSAPIPEFLKKDNPELELLYLTLRRADQAVLDELFEAITQHKGAMQHANLLPMESLLLVMLLEQRKWLRHALSEAQNELEALRREVNAGENSSANSR